MYDQIDQNQSSSEGHNSGGVDKARGPVVQRKGEGAAPSSTREIAASGFSGPTMDLPYRAEMEAGFGRSFSSVQAYGGGAASEANTAMNAQAYTVGQSIAFKDSNPDKAVVAHELAHTVQQGEAGPVQTWGVGKDGDAFESEADDAAATVLAGGRASVSMRTGPAIHKWGGSDHYTIGNLAGQKALQLFQAKFPGVDPMTPKIDVPAGPGTGGAPIGGGVLHGENAGDHPTSGPMEQHQPSVGIAGSNGDNSTLGIKTDTGQISFGAASRYGGDYTTTVGGLKTLRSDLGNTITEAPKGAGGGNWFSDKIQFAQMAIGGTTNSNHFFPVNRMEYQGHHNTAVGHARTAFAMAKSGNQKGAEDAMASAMQEEGFGNHFLQDTFASGHMAPRSLDSTEHLLGHGPGPIAKAMNNVANGIDSTVAKVTGGVGKVIGGVTGGIVGGIKGFASGVGDWFKGKWSNPFSKAKEQAVETGSEWGQAGGQILGGVGKGISAIATSPLHAPAAVQEAPGFMKDAANGLMRTKQWHDYFCALPEGLPTTRGRFHGDYFMDGNDLEVVSDTCANSIFNVLAAGQGQAANLPVDVPRPDFSAIMADQKIGPVWRLMMRDYEKDLQAAKDQVKEGDTHTTDGGTQVDSQWIINEIMNTTMGGEQGMADAKEMSGEGGAALGVQKTVTDAQKAPLETINSRRVSLRDAIDGVQHYASTDFGYNAKLGGGAGLDDDMNAPGDRGAEKTGFDPVQLESTFGLYSSLSRAASEFVVAASSAGSSVAETGTLSVEKELATEIAKTAQGWAQRAASMKGMLDNIMYGKSHGTIGSGEDQKKRSDLRSDVLKGIAEWEIFFGVAYSSAESEQQQKTGTDQN
jgi:hypothetical protein